MVTLALHSAAWQGVLRAAGADCRVDCTSRGAVPSMAVPPMPAHPMPVLPMPASVASGVVPPRAVPRIELNPRLARLREEAERIAAGRRPAAGKQIMTGLPGLDGLLGGGVGTAATYELVSLGGAATWALALHAAMAAITNRAELSSVRPSSSAALSPVRPSSSAELSPVRPPFSAELSSVRPSSSAEPPPLRPSPSNGSLSVRPAAAHRVNDCSALTGGRWLIWMDPEGELYPPAAAALGMPLERLLVMRAPRAADVLWATEQALRCRAVAAVVAPLRALDVAASRRLQLAAEEGGGVGLLLREGPVRGHCFSAGRLACEPAGGTLRVLRVRVTVLKLRETAPGATAVVDVPLTTQAGCEETAQSLRSAM